MAEVETTVKPKTTSNGEAPRTIIVQTTKPPLIPDENSTAYCFTRRNIFDAIIALAIAGAIIYFVMGRRGSGMSLNPFATGSSGYGATGAFGRMGTGTGMRAQAMRPGVDLSGIGQQIAGAIKKMFK